MRNLYCIEPDHLKLKVTVRGILRPLEACLPISQPKAPPNLRCVINNDFAFRLYCEQLYLNEFVAFQLFYKDHAIENSSAATKKKDIAMEFVYSVFSNKAQIQTRSLCLYTILLLILVNPKHSFHPPSSFDMGGLFGQKGCLISLGRIC